MRLDDTFTDNMSSTAFKKIFGDENRKQGIISRHLIFCANHNRPARPKLRQLRPFLRLLLLPPRLDWIETICHYYRLAFTDGACLSNGEDNVTAGIGVALGSEGPSHDRWTIRSFLQLLRD